MKATGYNYENLYQNGYYLITGKLEEECKLSEFVDFDHGFDFYAPQLFKDNQGRVIMIGWMGLPDVPYTNPTVENNWQHALTLPRKLTFKNGKVYQYPINETKALRKEKQVISLDITNEFTCPSNCFEFQLATNNQEFTMILRDDVTINYHNNVLTLKMESSGYGRDARHIVIDKLDNMTLFSDTSSLEIFFNDGEFALTTRIYSECSKISVDTTMQGIYYELDSYKII